jgi:predicted ribosome quality control (RQC) complex YloA/Tae2 family protein
MDNLVLIRVASALDDDLRASVLEDVRGEGLHRYRIIFRKEDRRRTVLLSLRPELPWIGIPTVRRKGKAGRRNDAFGAACRRALAGTVVESVAKPTSDRVVTMRFADGHALVAELATHGANLILLDREGRVVSAARNPRAARERITPGKTWKPRSLPPRQIDPFGSGPDAIGVVLGQALRDGEPIVEAIRRRLFGIGTEAARLVADEALARGVAAEEVLVQRLGQLATGDLDPVILAGGEPLELARQGRLNPGAVRLLPWDPGGEVASIRGRDAAATAGLYHESLELAAEVGERIQALRTILAKEIRRLWEVETRVAADLRGFEDPDRYRKWGEALLAGLAAAERWGEHVVVPDPWKPESSVIVPASPGVSLPAVADAHFRRHRRATRGLESARKRLGLVRSRRERLERLVAETEDAAGEDGSSKLEEGMRLEGIPVGLTHRRRCEGPGGLPARVEGVRMFTSTDGASILVGRTDRANDRLTFKIAGPEDFWLHVQGHPGAHVVIRNPRRLPRPSAAALEEAAVLAGWYSAARSEGQVDVHWTRRKYVRRARGAPTGTVKLKRFSILRVRPASPTTGEEPS